MTGNGCGNDTRRTGNKKGPGGCGNIHRDQGSEKHCTKDSLSVTQFRQKRKGVMG